MSLLPEVKDCSALFGTTDVLGATVPILGIAGDQQAATIGQGCFSAGMMKATYGTGCFALLNTGRDAVASEHKLLTTVAYQLEGEVTYALEGSIFVAGAVVQWLRDGLGVIATAADTQALAELRIVLRTLSLCPLLLGLVRRIGTPTVAVRLLG